MNPMSEQGSTGWIESPALIPGALRWLSGKPLLRLFRSVFAVYLFMLVLLPSGSLLGLNVKVLCFLLLVPIALQVSFARGQMTAMRLVRLLSIPAIMLLWVFVSLLYGFEVADAVAQYKDLLVTMTTCWLAAIISGDSRRDTLFLLRTTVYAEVTASILKVVLLGYAFARGIPVSTLIEAIHIIFGVQLMAFDFETALGRVQFISDNLIPLAIFAILCYRKTLGLRGGRALLMMLVLTISDLFSFSRYLWVFTVGVLILGLLLGKKDRFQVVLLTILGTLTLLSLPLLIVVVGLRFSTTVVTSSDADRIAQVAALRVFIADAPWFGHGLGSYTHRVIRSLEAPYSYEAQLLALFGQVGLVGVAYLGVLTLSYFRKLWPGGGGSALRRLGLLLLLLGWFAGGFLNPSVISSAAAVSYCAIFAMTALEDPALKETSHGQELTVEAYGGDEGA